ncbi:FG-GAP-like repeat-containing protein [Aurantibacillus circumpalustris]|uniref:FG-GAP-like repeat-containing protein n=1 Tax=Aurantibacillus circumpalustris TaxID=3036359 RepID=UPI00295AFF51|nr:FG-GAP-like repeat-containing protein [Aurantibacillus circumpalustris]
MKNFTLLVFLILHLISKSQVPPVCFNSLAVANISTVGIFPRDVCAADVNGDGKLDLITANESSSNISVLFGSGSGTFAPPVNYPVVSGPRSLSAADFNLDGYPDLVVANITSNNVAILFGSPSGTFAAAVNYSAGTNPNCVRVGDLNLDGNLDLVVANFNSSNVSILLGSTSGTFAAAVNYSVGSLPVSVCIADLNNDGNSDIVAANSGSNTVSLLLGSVSGTFAAAVNFTTGGGPYCVKSLDFNGDGNMDLSISNYNAYNLSILMGTGTGSFATPVYYPTGIGPTTHALGDFNNDGKTDVAVGNYSGNSISFFSGMGVGSFSFSGTYQLTDQPISMIAADFNADGIADIASVSLQGGKVTVIINTGNATLGAAIINATGNSPSSVSDGDFNSDGFKDLVVSNYGSNSLSILSGNGVGVFSTTATYFANGNPGQAVVADFNGDGHKDIAVANYGGASVSVLLGTGTGSFGATTNFAVGLLPYGIVSGDFNSDSKIDIAVTNFNSNSISVLFGLGSGGFGAAVNYSVGTNPTGLLAADFDLDGDLDLAITNSGSGNVSILNGSSSGVFTAGANYACGSGPYAIATADFNGDFIADLAVANYSSSSVSVLLGLGSGSFGTQAAYVVGANPVSVSVGDYNMDGIKDIVVSNYSSANISVLLGTGSSSFTSQINYSTGTNPRKVLSSDLNSDGKPDLAIVNLGSNSLQILLNAHPTLSLTTTNTVCLGNSLILKASGAGTYSWSTGATSHSISITPSTNSTYTVTAKSFGGCAATAVKSITVNALPLPTLSVNSGTICVGQSFTINPTGASTYTYSGGSAIVSPTIGSSYSVSGTNTLTGCISSSVVSNVTVFARPIVTASSGSICAGESFTLAVSGASSYSYSGGSAVVSPVTNTVYSVIGISIEGCQSLMPAISTVTVVALPIVSVNSGSICAGQTFTLQPSGGVTYFYSSGSSVISPTITTSYSVTGTNSLGCTSSPASISQVTVHDLPVISANDGTVCAGKAFTLAPSGALSYTFSNGNSVVYPLFTTSYSITGTSVAGCISAFPAISNVAVNPLPVIVISGNNSVCDGSPISLIGSGTATNYTWSVINVTGNLITVYPSSSTTYTLQGTNSYGCTSSVTKLITVLPLPIITLNSGTICQGATFTLNPIGGITYTYSSGSPLVSPLVTNVYTVTGTDANACVGKTTSTVTVLQAPAINVVADKSEICLGETIFLHGLGATFYVWSNGQYSASINVSPTVTSTYTVEGVDNNSCTNDASITVFVNECVGVANGLANVKRLFVFPNPSSGEFFVESSDQIQLLITNALGQIILRMEVSQGINKIDLADYSSGVYFILHKKGSLTETIKLIKN